jgi:uncharacterized protein (DUF486 family)
VESHRGELGNCVLRILLSGSGQPLGLVCEFTGAQLKTIQEVITLTVFAIFSISYLGEAFKWNYAAGFAFISVGAFFVFHQW